MADERGLAGAQALVNALMAGQPKPEPTFGSSSFFAGQQPNWFGRNVLANEALAQALMAGNFLLPGAKPRLPMDLASRMARAKAQGFNVDETFYHGTALPKVIDQFRPGQFNTAHVAHETPAMFFTNDPNLAAHYAYDTGIQRRDAILSRASQRGVSDEKFSRLYPEPTQVSNAAAREFQDKAIAALGEYGRVLGPSVRSGTKLDYAALAKELGPEAANAVKTYQELAATVGSWYPDRSAIYPVHVSKHLADADSGFFGNQFNTIVYDQLLKGAKEGGYAGLRLRNIVDSPSGHGNRADVIAVFDPKDIRSKWAGFEP